MPFLSCAGRFLRRGEATSCIFLSCCVCLCYLYPVFLPCYFVALFCVPPLPPPPQPTEPKVLPATSIDELEKQQAGTRVAYFGSLTYAARGKLMPAKMAVWWRRCCWRLQWWPFIFMTMRQRHLFLLLFCDRNCCCCCGGYGCRNFVLLMVPMATVLAAPLPMTAAVAIGL